MNSVFNPKLFYYFIILLLGLSFIAASTISAQTPTLLEGTSGASLESCNKCDGTNDKPECKQYCGNYELDDFVHLIIKVSEIILSVSGSLALLAFVYGGVMFLISGGSSERVTKGKQILIGAVIGLVIVFTSFMIIGFVFKATGIETNGTAWARSGWFQSQQK